MTEAILKDNVGILNLALVKGVDKAILLTMLAEPVIDITGWLFEVAVYDDLIVKTVILSSATGGISVDPAAMTVTLNFSDAVIAELDAWRYQWDLRFNTLAGDKGQLLKGMLTMAAV